MRAPTPVRSSVRTLVVAAGLLAAVSSSLVAQTHQTIHSFPTEAQYGPEGSLLHASNGKWYGLVPQGGPYGRGSIYTLTPGASGFAYDEIHVFHGGAEGEGDVPLGGLVEATDGYLYGVTIYGGAFGGGSIYRLDLAGNVTIVHSFSDDEGAFPLARLILASDGFLYGTTDSLGQLGNGSAFRFDFSSDALVVVHAFTGDEGHPQSSLIETSSGVFCGTSQAFPPVGFPGVGPLPGRVFRLDTAGSFTTLREFSGEEGDVLGPGLVLASDGKLYGGTLSSGSGTDYGGLYRINTDGTGFEVLHSFVQSDGVGTYQPLVSGPDGFLYGVTSYGGAAGAGTVFRLGTDGSFESLLSFPSDGPRTPSGPLAVDGDGFLGPSSAGQAGTIGTVYRLDDAFALTAIREFRRLEFSHPADELVEATDGKLYGASSVGGELGLGVIYKTDLEGNVEIVHSAAGNDGSPYGWLVKASDSSLYGTTSSVSGQSPGVLYRLDPNGDFTILQELNDQASYGTFSLFEGSDGYLYGPSFGRIYRFPKSGDPVTTWNADSSLEYFLPGFVESAGFLWGTVAAARGGIFRVDLQGNFSLPIPYEFAGCCPGGGLMHGSDGSFYGTTFGGGIADVGSVFRYEPKSGVLTTLHDFAGPLAGDGYGPTGRLLEVGDGYLYGVTAYGGLYNLGTVFRVRMAGGDESVLHHFGGSGDAAAQLQSGLIRADDGNLYGTEWNGGEYGGGAIYRIDPSQVVPITAITPDSGPADGGTTITIEGGSLGTVTSVWIGQKEAEVSPSGLAPPLPVVAVAPPLAPGTLNHVFVLNSYGGTGSLSRAWLADFLDVPQSSIFHDAIEALIRNGVSVGCGSGLFCLNAHVTRAQMAILLLKATQGYAYVPPPFTGTVFADVYNWTLGASWIEDLARRGITAGCGGGNYCPDGPVSRDQMAVFLLKALLGSSYTPPAATGVFADVPPEAFAADWVEDLYAKSITAGCATVPLRYCPSLDVTRGQMAGFLTKTFGMQEDRP